MKCISLFILALGCFGAVAHDGEANVTGTMLTVSTKTLSAKTTAGSDRVGIVTCGWGTDTNTISGVTWGGVAMTSVLSATETVGAGLRTHMWRIIAPPTGASDVVITWTGTVKGACAASSYNTVDQTTPVSNSAAFNTAGSSASPITLTCTSANGEIVVDSVSVTRFDGSEVYTVGSGQTQIQNATPEFYFGLSSREGSTTTSTVMSWTFTSGTSHWATVCASLKEAGGGSPAAPKLLLLGVGE